MKNSLVILFLIAIFYVFVQTFLKESLLAHPFWAQAFSLFFLWCPGIVAFLFGRKEMVPLPIFAKFNRSVFMIPVYTFGIALFAFLLSIPFGFADVVNPVFVDQTWVKKIGYGALFFVTNFVFIALLFSFVFLGGELYWRGYLWEKLKSKGAFKAIWTIALIWTLWQLPITLLTYSPNVGGHMRNVLFTFVLNFALAPILVYFRVQGKSIFPAALFYSSMLSAFLYFILLFPSATMRLLGIYGGFILLGLALFALFHKLYSPQFWKKLV